MPHLARVDIGDNIYHVINRATGCLQTFNEKKGTGAIKIQNFCHNLFMPR
jgi:hypothetical protein